jgi:hypothetical protein
VKLGWVNAHLVRSLTRAHARLGLDNSEKLLSALTARGSAGTRLPPPWTCTPAPATGLTLLATASFERRERGLEALMLADERLKFLKPSPNVSCGAFQHVLLGHGLSYLLPSAGSYHFVTALSV